MPPAIPAEVRYLHIMQSALPSTWSPPVRTWLLGTGILVLLRLAGGVIPLAGPTGWTWITRISETWIVGGLLVIALSKLDFKGVVGGAGKARVIGLISLGLLMFAGQHLEISPGTYPFVQWSMYTAPVAEIPYTEIVLRQGGNDLGPLPLVGVTSITTEPRIFLTRVGDLASRAQDGDGSAREAVQQAVQTLVAEIETDADEVHVRGCTVTEPALADPSDCRLLVAVELGP